MNIAANDKDQCQEAKRRDYHRGGRVSEEREWKKSTEMERAASKISKRQLPINQNAFFPSHAIFFLLSSLPSPSSWAWTDTAASPLRMAGTSAV